MSSLNVNIVNTNGLNEFNINLLSPLSIFSLDEQFEKQIKWSVEEQPEWNLNGQVTKSEAKTKARTARSETQKQPTLTCLNCCPKKIKVLQEWPCLSPQLLIMSYSVNGRATRVNNASDLS